MEVKTLQKKEKPILFQGEMVRQILAGKKTQTRRIARENRFCPYGNPGDLLWVCESFSLTGDPNNPSYLYRADEHNSNTNTSPWKPSIHMPRAACRIILQITKSWRLEPLTAITHEDALAEGCYGIETFKKLWISIHGTHSWDLNPWVWVVAFERIQGGL